MKVSTNSTTDNADAPSQPLTQLSGQPLTTALVRNQAIQLQSRLQEMFNAGKPAESISQFRCKTIDTLLQEIWQQTIHNKKLSLLAVGGYGRGELQPGSDIDLLIVADRESQLDESKTEISAFITLLWDMGLEVGQSVRTLAQCASEARKDITVATALMEVRDLCGPPRVGDLERVLSSRRQWSSRKFFLAKLEEQRQRHLSFGESSYMLEPNIKESPGGLRDLQTILWIAKRHYKVALMNELVKLGFLEQDELETLRRVRNFFWWIRTGLHLLNGRKDDQLLFHHQRELARLAGYEDSESALAVEIFMKSYYQAVMELRRLNEMLMQRLREEILMGRRSNRTQRLNDRFQLRKQHIEVVDPQVFVRNPEALVELFLLLAKYKSIIHGVHADTIRLVRNHCYLIDDHFRQNSVGNQFFIELLAEPYGVFEELRRMHRYGVLGALFPEFQRVTGQMQHDLFHVYTVDEHSLLCVRNVLRFASEEVTPALPECQQLYLNLPRPECLLIAALTHDIGKGLGGNHSQLGAQTATQICSQLKLSTTDSETVVWLVGVHLDMSSLSQNADTSDADVISRFADHVGSLENLDYLYLLTIADMQATGPSVWNSWKGSLLRQLYRITRRQIQHGGKEAAATTRLSTTLNEALALLPNERVTASQAQSFWDTLDDEYFQRFSPAEMAWHAHHIIPVLGNRSAQVVATRNLPERGGTGVFVYTADRPKLFAAIASELDKQGLKVVDARIMTTADSYALDTFIVLDTAGKAISSHEGRQTIRHALRRALASTHLTPKPSTRRADRQIKAFRFPAVIRFEPGSNAASRIMELTANDHPGLLVTVATILANHYVSILSARLNTYGERVQDQFTITMPDLDEAATQALLAELRAELAAAFDPATGQKTAPITMDRQR